MRKLLPFALLLLLSALSGCLTVEESPGVTHRASAIQLDYAHFFLWDWCPHVGWVRTSEFTAECRCFDENGDVLLGCQPYEFPGKHNAEKRRAAEQEKWNDEMDERRRHEAIAAWKRYCAEKPEDVECRP